MKVLTCSTSFVGGRSLTTRLCLVFTLLPSVYSRSMTLLWKPKIVFVFGHGSTFKLSPAATKKLNLL